MKKEMMKNELHDEDLEQVVGGASTLATDSPFNEEPLSQEESHYKFVHDLIFETWRKNTYSHDGFVFWATQYVESDYQQGNLSYIRYQQLLVLISTL